MTHQAEFPKPRAARAADICVIKNPGAGKQLGGRTIERLETLFAAYPGRFELRVVESGRDIVPAARRALDEGFATLVAAGGDGTICAVASALVGTQATLGVLPLGTFNYFARSLAVPSDLAAAVRILVEGETATYDVGEVNGRVFLNNASLGLYPTILRKRERIYKRWGRSRLVAYGSVLLTVLGFRKPLALRVTVDGCVQRVRTPMAFIANNPAQLDEIGVEGACGVRTGRFALFIAPDCTRLQLLRYALRLALRSMKAGRDFDLVHGREIVVETSRRRMTVACDGERARMEGPFRFTLRRGALRVLAPAP